MDRRTFLLGGGAGLAVVGGLWLLRDDPEIRGSEPTLAPGETGTITVAVKDVTSLQFDPGAADGERGVYYGLGPDTERSGGSPVVVDIGGAEVSPPPDSQADSMPPIWQWDRATDVRVSAPVYVATDAEPGTYRYGVASGGDTETFAITVRSADSSRRASPL